MSYQRSRPITQPLPEDPTWRISGRYGNYFVYINVERYATTATSYDAIKKVKSWIKLQHPYLSGTGGWLEGPFVQQVAPGIDLDALQALYRRLARLKPPL